MLSFFTVSKCYLFYVIIFPYTYFVLSFTVIRTFTSWKRTTSKNMITSSTIKKITSRNSKIIYIYTIKMKTSRPSKMITFTPWKMITSSTLEIYNIQAFKNGDIYTWKMIRSATLEKIITSEPSKMITFTPWKMITYPTLEKDNIKELKNYDFYTMNNDNILYTWKW
jgi:hypothetical protein